MPWRPDRTPLRSGEIAAAGALSAIAVGLVVVGSVVPHAGPVQVFAVVPYGVVAERHRRRAVVASMVAGAWVGTLIIGIGGGLAIGVCALLGGFVGGQRRRGHGIATIALVAAVVAPVLAAATVGLLAVLASARRLAIQSLQSTFRGIASVLRHLGPLRPAGSWIDHAVATLTGHWQLTVAAIVLIVIPFWLIGSWLLIVEVLERLDWVSTATELSSIPPEPQATAVQAPAPVQVVLHVACVSYGQTEALVDVDLEVPVGQFIVVVGANGSGKSTLGRLLAGAKPTTGSVTRAGPVGLGRIGGTAMIAQRPDAQVVGLRVADDVVWGLPVGHGVDVENLLESVGLGGLATHDTATLSGGQLQRLAVAAALARRPRLLISDESTAMVDPAGREALIRLFAELPRRWPMTVLHITHNVSEVAAADRVVQLSHGRLVDDAPAAREATQAPDTTLTRIAESAETSSAPRRAGTSPQPPLPDDRHLTPMPTTGLGLADLGYIYAYGTVWARRALKDVTLSIRDGEGLLFAGDNGSGKSTLAWIIAGLLRPTEGTCLLDGSPTHRRRGGVTIAFQHARLQLQRPTVGADIADAAGWSHETHELRHPDHDGRSGRIGLGGLQARIGAALSAVGLEPALATRSIEQLSGGQQRRVVIAGLLARNPRVLVLDEPLAGLDAPTRTGLADLLAELRERAGLTVIVVTHDPEPLTGVCPRLVRLDRGRVVDDTSPAASAGELRSTAA